MKNRSNNPNFKVVGIFTFIWFLLFTLTLIIIFYFASAKELVFVPESNSGNASILHKAEDWRLTKFDGTEALEYTTYIQDGKLCVDPIGTKTLLSPSVNNLNLYTKLGDKTLEDKKDDLVIDSTLGFVNDICYTPDTKTETYVQFGDNSVIYEYQNLSMIYYDFDWGHTNVTLLKDGKTDLSLFVFNDSKFGANDTSMNETELANYSYVVTSNRSLILINNHVEYFNGTDYINYSFPKLYNHFPNEWEELRQWYDFEDVCSKNYSNCKWSFEDNIAVINFTSNKYIDPAIENITGCRTLYNSTYYTLDNDIHTGASCLIIANNSITIDFQGHFINDTSPGSTEYGVTSGATFGFNDTTIKNGYIYDFGVGIALIPSTQDIYNLLVDNMTIISNVDYIGGPAMGINLLTVNFFNITIHNINASVYNDGSFSVNGVGFNVGGVSTVINNLLINNSYFYNTDVGIQMMLANPITNSSITNLIFQNMTSDPTVTVPNAEASIVLAQNVSISNVEINTTTIGGWSVALGGSFTNGNIIRDMYAPNSNVLLDTFGAFGVPVEVQIINATYINNSLDAGAILYREWYFIGNATDSDGNPLNNVNITAYNASGNIEFSVMTGADGLTPMQEITEYHQIGSTVNPYKNYTLNATLGGYVNDSHSYNVSLNENNFNEVFTLSEVTQLPGLTIELDDITGDTNVTQNETFNVSVTVTCVEANCGEVNISLDPIPQKTFAPSTIFTNTEWVINKTGAEVNLNITIDDLNETTSRVNIDFVDKTKYFNDISLQGRDLESFPITKLDNNDKFYVDKSLLKLSDKDNLLIHHGGNKSLVELKLGWNSVTITTTVEAEGTEYPISDSMCIAPDGTYWVTYESAGDDMGLANSTDGGTTWANVERVTTAEQLGINCLANGTLFIYHITSGNAWFRYYDVNEQTFSGSATSILDEGSNLNTISCSSDANSNTHCALIENNAIAHYTNSTMFGSQVVINDNGADDSDLCSIEVDQDGCPYVGCAGTDQDDTDFWSPCLNGWGDSNRVQMYDGSTVNSINADSLVFDIEENNIYAVVPGTVGLWFCNSTLDNIAGSTCRNVTPANSVHPSIGVNSDHNVFIVYSYSNSPTQTFFYSNATKDGDYSFTSATVGTGWVPTIADSNFPISNRMTNNASFVWTDNTPSVLFESFGVQYTPPSEPSVKGLISNVTGTTPFYLMNPTNNTNPLSINLNANESYTWIFEVNATGEIDAVNEFYAYVNVTSNMTRSNESLHWNVTIVAPDDVPPQWSFIPPDLFTNSTTAVDLNFTATDNVEVSHYIVNDTVNFNMTSSNGILTNNTLLLNGTLYHLLITVNDTSQNINTTLFQVNITDLETIPSEINLSLFLKIPSTDIYKSPTTNITVMGDRNITNCQFAFDDWSNGNYSMFEVNGSEQYFGINNFTNQNYTIFFKCEDLYGYTNGTEYKPINVNYTNITSCLQLETFIDHDNDARYFLANDIDCINTSNLNHDLNDDAQGFEPITNLLGIFDGQNHTISNLRINRSADSAIALFASASGTITNLGLDNVSISGGTTTAGLSASGSVDISNVFVKGNVTGYTKCGLMAGQLSSGGSITNSYVVGRVNCTFNNGGLLVGYQGFGGVTTITNAYSVGSIFGGKTIGGLVGINLPNNNINNVWTDSNVSIDQIDNVGGLIGDYNTGGGFSGFYNNISYNPINCTDGENSGCLAVQNNTNYFKDDVDITTAMANWDFVDVWQEVSQDYPVLKWEGTGTIITDSDIPYIQFDSLTPANNSNLEQDSLKVNITWDEFNYMNITFELTGNSTNFTTFNSVPLYEFNFTGLTPGVYYYNVTICDKRSNCNTTETRLITLTGPDVSPPLIEFESQIPADITTTNLLIDESLIIIYNITDDTGVDNTTVTIYYETNHSSDIPIKLINGTDFSGLKNMSYTVKDDVTFYNFSIDENDVYGGTYNLESDVFENNEHTNLILNANNQWAKQELLNVSDNESFNFLMIMVNASEDSDTLTFWYCNETYSTGNPSNSDNCVNFFSTNPTPLFNITKGNSSHKIVPMIINTTTGHVGDVKVTPTSYFLIRGSAIGSSGRHFWYVDNTARNGSAETTINNGATWTSQSYTFDLELHQFEGTEYFNYYVCANDTLQNANCSDIRSDALELGGLPPSSPIVYYPVNGTYSGLLQINYTASTSPNGYDITHYNITLEYENQTLVDLLTFNNSLNLNFTFNTSLYNDSEYIVKVYAHDNLSQVSFGISEVFLINNSIDLEPPQWTFIPPNMTVNDTTYQLDINFTATDNIAILNYSIDNHTDFNMTISNGILTNSTPLINGTTTLINVTVFDTSDNYNETIFSLFVNYSSSCTELLEYITTSELNITGCQLNDSITTETNYTYYDIYFCGETGNTTFTNYTNTTCDNCTPIVANYTLSESNSSCTYFDNLTNTIDWLNYDTQYCFDTTQLESDDINESFQNVSVIQCLYPPDIEIIYPLPTAYFGNVTSLTFTVDDYSGVDYCVTNWNGTNSSNTDPCTNLTGLYSNDGSNTWYVFAWDLLGSFASKTVTFTMGAAGTTAVDCRYLSFGYYNLKLPFMVEEDCLK